MATRIDALGRSRFKLGFFGANCSSGLACTKVAERWSGSWEDNLALARAADAAGIDFMLPVGRWKGYGGETNFMGATLETLTWACGLLAQTERIVVFATVHAPLVHPVFAAKQFVTADHIGRGRFALNIVCGWNQGEFDMFGVEQREHDERYDYGAAWLDAIWRMWSEPGPFDVENAFFRLRQVEAEPKPYGGTRPIVMNAGSSTAGRDFGARYCDVLFRSCRTVEQGAEDVRTTLAEARSYGREIGVYTTAYVVCRPTMREAQEYERYVADENGDWGAIDHHLAVSRANNHTLRGMTDEQFAVYRRGQAVGHGGYPLVGDPDHVAREIGRIADAGFGGLAFAFVNFRDELPYFRDEVLPRLERMGLRAPADERVPVSSP
jgi:alkanesulfonate monooxygenase SsuD/methylene tetrahydromethanopterin reductase-like flavin-dependent oxidoreductase (luciferase family)